MKVFITNTSRHPATAVRWLVNFAAREVYAVAKREGWSDRFDNTPTLLRFTNTRHAYCGRYLGRYRAWALKSKAFNPVAYGLDGSDYVRNILCRVGASDRFPASAVYPRYQQMPEYSVADWQEAVVMIAAHELAHTSYSGNKDGEFNCELVAHDAVEAFRRERGAFDAHLAAAAQKESEREVALAAKNSPQAVAEKKLADAQRAVDRWSRKLKLAKTKLTKYTRAVKRAQLLLQRSNESTLSM